MPRTMTLHSRCRTCECEVDLGFTPWAGRGPAVAAEWTCPACHAINSVPAIGEVAWVERHIDTPPSSSHPDVARTH